MRISKWTVCGPGGIIDRELSRSRSARIRSSYSTLIIAFAMIVSASLMPASSSARDAPARPPASRPATRIVLLGTEGGPAATKFRSEPATLLIVDGATYLVDAGAGVSRQLPWSGYAPSQIQTIFITHHHIDHDSGLVSLMGLSWFDRAWSNIELPPVQIYGPPSTQYLVRTALDYLSVSERIFRAGVPALKKAASMFVGHDVLHDGLAYEDTHVRVTAVANTHFHFQSKSEHGEIDKSYSYRFDTPAGSVVFTGDTGVDAAVTELAQGADVLVSEVCATEICGPSAQAPKSLPSELARQEEFHMTAEHLTPEDVGKMAAAAHVKVVLLTHLVSTESDDLSKVSVFVPRVKKFYSGPVVVGSDMFEYDVVKGSEGPQTGDIRTAPQVGATAKAESNPPLSAAVSAHRHDEILFAVDRQGHGGSGDEEKGWHQ